MMTSESKEDVFRFMMLEEPHHQISMITPRLEKQQIPYSRRVSPLTLCLNTKNGKAVLDSNSRQQGHASFDEELQTAPMRLYGVFNVEDLLLNPHHSAPTKLVHDSFHESREIPIVGMCDIFRKDHLETLGPLRHSHNHFSVIPGPHYHAEFNFETTLHQHQ